MNNKGQSLVLFVLLLPIIVLIFIYIIMLLLGNYNNKKIEGVINNNLVSVLNNDIRDIDKIKDVLNSNDITNNSVVINEDLIEVNVSIKEKNAFLKEEVVSFTYCGNYLTKEINKGECNATN